MSLSQEEMDQQLETGRIEIRKIVGVNGKIGTHYDIQGMNTHEAIGTLMAVCDVIRYRERMGWGAA